VVNRDRSAAVVAAAVVAVARCSRLAAEAAEAANHGPSVGEPKAAEGVRFNRLAVVAAAAIQRDPSAAAAAKPARLAADNRVHSIADRPTQFDRVVAAR
jgi:hypothetical protein